MQLAYVSGLSTLLLALSANAAIIKGGITFEDNAFADAVLSQSGTFTTSGGTLATVMTDLDEGTWAVSFSVGAFATMGFTDNFLVNGSGPDLAIFEVGDPELFRVSISGVTNTYQGAFAGYQAGGFNVNIAQINLDDFGVAANALLSQITLSFEDAGSSDVPDFSLVGAINSAPIPEPQTYALMLAGLLGLVSMARRRV